MLGPIECFRLIVIMSRLPRTYSKRRWLALVSLLVLPLIAHQALALAIVVAPNCLKADPRAGEHEPCSLGTTIRRDNGEVASVLEPEGRAKGSHQGNSQ